MALQLDLEEEDAALKAIGETLALTEQGRGKVRYEMLPLEKIILDDENPRDYALNKLDIIHGIQPDDVLLERKQKEKTSLESIAKSIQQHDVICPILVYPYKDQYKLIAGERRVLASLMINAEYISARIISQTPNKSEISILQWIENIEREGLSLWERLENLRKIIYTNKIKATPSALSKILHCSKTQAYKYASLLNCENRYLLDKIQNGEINNINNAIDYIKLNEEELNDILTADSSSAIKAQMKSISQKRKVTNKGRKSRKIFFGETSNMKVAKELLAIITESKRGKIYVDAMGNKPDWNKSNIADINLYLSNLLRLIEESV